MPELVHSFTGIRKVLLERSIGVLRLLVARVTVKPDAMSLDPDRHVGPDHRVPSIEEARAVVHQAVTIAQWGRDDLIARRAADYA